MTESASIEVLRAEMFHALCVLCDVENMSMPAIFVEALKTLHPQSLLVADYEQLLRYRRSRTRVATARADEARVRDHFARELAREHHTEVAIAAITARRDRLLAERQRAVALADAAHSAFCANNGRIVELFGRIHWHMNTRRALLSAEGDAAMYSGATVVVGMAES